MSVLKLGALFLAAAATGSAATLLVDRQLRDPGDSPPKAVESSFDEQIERMQTLLNDEISARVALQDYVYESGSVDEPPQPVPGADSEGRDGPAGIDDVRSMRFGIDNPRIQEMMRRRQPGNIKQRLMDSGFGEDEAEWVLQRQAEIQLAQLQEDYNARRARAQDSPSRPTGAQQLRTELGDNAYQRYLESLGAPTNVPVMGLVPSSPGVTAGLQLGDRVVSYNGERVFSMQDLNTLTLRGSPGESVVMEVQRDGRNVALVVPRGPIGFSSSPFRRGGR